MKSYKLTKFTLKIRALNLIIELDAILHEVY